MSNLRRTVPVEQGVDPAAVLGFVDAVDADPDVELHSLMVLRHGCVVAEGWWAPYTPERARLVYSLSKSVTSTALAIAVGEGLVGLEDTAISHFQEFAAEITDERSRSITVRDLASMAAGHDHDMWPEAVTNDPEEPVRGFLLLPPDASPGSVFAYSQPCTYTLAAIIQRRTGMRLTDYLRPRLLDPLGIGEVSWQCRPAGRELGFSGLFATTEDMARLGQLYLQRGRWGDRQLVPESYVAEATSRQVPTRQMENVDWQQGYGYQFWMSRHGFRGDGAFGQLCLVLSELDSVVAMTGGTEAVQSVLSHVWEHLLPGLGVTGPDDQRRVAVTQEELDWRLRDLSLVPVGGTPSPSTWEDWVSAPFLVTSGPEPTEGSHLTSVTLATTDHGLEIGVEETGNSLTFGAGSGRWDVSEPSDIHGLPVPVAASAAWTDDHTLEIDVAFLETPHRLAIVCSLPARTAQTAWQVAPLDGGRLNTLRRPRRHP